MQQIALSLALAAFAFMMSLIWGTPFIRALSQVGILDTIEDGPGPEDWLKVPTLGGILVILPVIFFAVVLNFADATGLTGLGISIFLPVVAMVAFSAIGAWQDLKRTKSAGSPISRVNFALQVAFAVGLAYALKVYLDVPEMYFPFQNGEIELGLWYIPAAALIILLSANAVGSTTGMNGLSGLLMVTAFAAYGAISAAQGQIYITRFCFTLVGALFGFLWFNIKPASLLIGKTGAISLGATLAVIALMTAQWPLLVFVALIPLVEFGSSIVDAALLRRTAEGHARSPRPLHSHLSAGGWSGTQIIQRLWLIQLLFAMIGISLARV